MVFSSSSFLFLPGAVLGHCLIDRIGRKLTNLYLWINTKKFELIAQDQYRITPDNYLAFLEAEQEYYLHFDYNSLFCEDYQPAGEP